MKRSTFLLLLGVLLSSVIRYASGDPTTVAGSPGQGVGLKTFSLVGDSMQSVLMTLPSPSSVYLAGEDAELPHPRESDSVIFRYELDIELRGARPAVIFVNFDPETYRVNNVQAVIEERVNPELMVEAFGSPYHQQRLRVATDDIDFWVTDDEDPQGEALRITFPADGVTVLYFDFLETTTIRFD